VDKTRSIQRWYRLDNAANVYPAVRSRKRPGVFRVSATLKEAVDPQVLQLALDDTLKRIPNFSVKLQSGLFWHYFRHSDEKILVQPDVINPCMWMSGEETKGFLIRVRFHGRRIALEVFHSIADGSGAMVFLKTLVAQYLNLRGADIPAANGILDCTQPPHLDESADAFPAFAGKKRMRGIQERRAFQIPGSLLRPYNLKIITGTIAVKDVRKKAKEYGVSITEYLAAVFLHTLDRFQRFHQPVHLLPVIIQVPVNLRQFNGARTLRNFSSYVCPGLDPRKGVYTFDEVIVLVHHFLRLQVTEKNMRARVADNVKIEKNRLLRIMPLFIKNRIIHLGYKALGPVSITSTLSNLGVVKVPDEILPYVEAFDVILGGTPETKVKCALAGFNGRIRINFTSVIEETTIERAFFTFLVEQSIPVNIESNQE